MFHFALLVIVTSAAFSRQLPVRLYKTQDGLAGSQIVRIFRDSHGFLWFCTREGLSRFDGTSFSSYFTSDGLPYGLVFDIAEGRNGEYWVATHRGLARFDPAATPRFTRKAVGGDLRRSVRKLHFSRSGVLWVGSDEGLYRQSGEGFERVEFLPSPQRPLVAALLEDRRGALWIGTNKGLFLRMPDGAVERQQGLPAERVDGLLEDGSGRIWVATERGLCLLEAGTAKEVGASQTGSASIRSVMERADGSIWAATARGVLQAAPQISLLTAAEGLMDASSTSLAEDEAGNLWVGTHSGVARISHSGFSTYGVRDGLTTSDVASVFAGRDGRLLVETLLDRPILHSLNGERFTSISLKFPALKKVGGWTGHICFQDRDGDWWFATSGGLYRSGPNGVSRVASNEIEVIFQDSHGNVWFHEVDVATLKQWERATGNVRPLSPESTGVPPNADIGPLIEDNAGNLWIGLAGSPIKLVRYRKGRSDRFGVDDGIPNGPLIALYLDEMGRLWAGSMDGGLIRMDHPDDVRPAIRSYGRSQGLSTSYVPCITSDRWNRIYACTTLGVDRLDPETGKIEHFGVTDGLPGERLHHAFRDKNGTLWFATAQGLARFDPEPPSTAHVPSALITAVRVRGVPQNVSDLGVSSFAIKELADNQNQIQIEFGSVNFVTVERVRYQYRMGNEDRDWSQPATARSVNFASVRPGRYRFEVRAVSIDGEVSKVPASVEFAILPSWWQRTWVQAMAAVALMVIIFLAHQYRIRYLLGVERLRMRIASDLHDDVGSSLSQIAILSEVARRDSPKGELDKIASISRDALRSISDIIWAVDPDRDSLGDLITRMRQFAYDLFASGEVELRFEAAAIPRDIGMGAEGRRQLFLIYKEALHNVAKHSKSTRVDVEVAMQEGTLVVGISDNGRGFEVENPRAGNGLRSMTERARLLGGTLSIQSRAGLSEVTLRVPVAGNWKRRYTRV